MAHTLAFVVGDWVVITQDKFKAVCSHKGEIGSRHRIVQVVIESRSGDKAKDFQEYQLSSGAWVCEDEIAITTNKN